MLDSPTGRQYRRQSDLDLSVRPYERFLLDTREIAPDGPAAATEVCRRTTIAGTRFTPVTGVSRSADVPAALAHRNNGIAVRVTRELDQVVDLGAVEDLIAEGIANLTREFLAAIPDQAR